MQYHTLPVSGGIYDQDPQLLDEWQVISDEVAKVRNSETEKVNNQVTGLEKNQPNTPAMRKSVPSGKEGGLEFKRVPTIPKVFQRYHKSK